MTRSITGRSRRRGGAATARTVVRGCALALALWAATTLLYLLVLSRWLEGDDLAIAPVLSFFGLWLGSAVWWQLVPEDQERAIRRALRGGTPREGERWAAIGTLLPDAEPLQAPFTGRPCVAYEYDVFTMVDGALDEPVKVSDYNGMARTPCRVRTERGDVPLLGLGSLGELPTDELAFEEVAARAFDYIACTGFTPFDRGLPLARGWRMAEDLAAARSARFDSRSDRAALGRDRRITERVVPAAVPACAVGRYRADEGALGSTLADPVQLHLGTPDQVLSELAGRRRAQLWVGLILFVLTHGAYVAYLAITGRGPFG